MSAKRCAFCGKARDATKRMLEGVAKTALICDECIAKCQGILAEDERVTAAARDIPLTLRDAFVYLSQHAKVLHAVSGSDAKHVEELADAVYRISQKLMPKEPETIPGPTRSGLPTKSESERKNG